MSDIAASIIASSKVISAPVGEAVSSEAPDSVNAEVRVPLVADAIGIGIFFGDTASEICSPEMLSNITSKVTEITNYVREHISTHSDEAVKTFMEKLSSENEWTHLKPTERLEKFYDYVDLQKRMSERKNINTIIKQLKESVHA